MARRPHMSSQFEFIHEKVGKGSHILRMNNFDGEKATLEYDHYTDADDEDMPSRIEASYLRSPDEGKGHARKMMQHLYDRYPKSFIDWGRTIHPASTHLAEEFETKYYNRTAYEPDHDGSDW